MKPFPIRPSPAYRPVWRLLSLYGLSALLLGGCVATMLRLSPGTLDRFSNTLFAECDLELAASAIPSQLKLLEALLAEDPENVRVLSNLCMGYAGYTLLFVEDKDPGRASRLYLRARDFGLRSLAAANGRPPALEDAVSVEAWCRKFAAPQCETLFWLALAWSGWANLNLDQPAALAQLTSIQSCLERTVQVIPGFFYGGPCILYGSYLAARPPLLGGNTAGARELFQQALAEGQDRFLMAHYYLARYYAVRVQDKSLFLHLLERIEHASPQALPDVCLVNAAVQDKARTLRRQVDQLFY